MGIISYLRLVLFLSPHASRIFPVWFRLVRVRLRATLRLLSQIDILLNHDWVTFSNQHHTLVGRVVYLLSDVIISLKSPDHLLQAVEMVSVFGKDEPKQEPNVPLQSGTVTGTATEEKEGVRQNV